MSPENKNTSADYKKTLLDNLNYMEYSKSNNESQSEFEKNSFENKIPSAVLDNSTFRTLFDIAWKNCDNEEKTINEMDNYIDLVDAQFNQAEVLDQVTIAYQFLTNTAKEQFYKDSTEKYYKALKKIAQKRTSSFIRSHKNEKVYDVIPVEKKFDKFGSWKIDRLADHMKVYLIRTDLMDLPQLWRTNENTKFLIEEKSFKEKEIFEETEPENITLRRFLVQELKIFDQKQLDQSLEILNQKSIFSVKDLAQVNYWEEIEHSLPAHSESLKISIEQYKSEQVKPIRSEQTSKRTQAELLHDWNKVKLFLFYESGMTDEIKSTGMLDKEALELGFQEQRNNPDFDGGPVLNNIEKVMEQYTFPSKPFRKNSHGILLYGPPGTGKTELCSIVIRKTGLHGLVPPLSSSELNRSKIGETEQLLMAIFHRALHLPYLLCCVTIDEIDALTPKRTEKSGEQKVDVLCLLLSLLGGIKDVKNVFVIASTNRLNKMDEAFARRLQDKFYVGHLSAEQRFRFIEKIKLPVAQIPNQFRTLFDDANRVNLFKLMTFNFSGAALVSLRSKFLYYFDRNSNKQLENIDRDLIRICSKVADDFQIKIGGFSIPELLLSESDLDKLETNLKANFDADDLAKMSGRILIDLRPDFLSIQMEYIDESLKEINLARSRRFTSDIVTILLQLAMLLEVPYFQLIDSSLALASSAFDENSIIEMIIEKLNEYEQYEDSMLVFDADTLVGISESLIDSSTQQDTLSYSFQNGHIWQQIILNSFKSEFASQQGVKHRWCVIISSNEFLINQFKKMTKFEYCGKEEELLVKERVCCNCKLKYIQKENRRDSCLYHPKRELERIKKPTVKLANATGKQTAAKETLMELANEVGLDVLNDYYYKCCMKHADESEGCRKDYHREKEEPKKKISYANLLKQAPIL